MRTPIANNQVQEPLSSSSPDDAAYGHPEIRLMPQRAADWLVCLEELQTVSNAEELAHFCNALSDACWLARWKREEVIVEFNPLWLPGLLAVMASEASASSCRPSAIEDMLSAISRYSS